MFSEVIVAYSKEGLQKQLQDFLNRHWKDLTIVNTAITSTQSETGNIMTTLVIFYK